MCICELQRTYLKNIANTFNYNVINDIECHWDEKRGAYLGFFVSQKEIWQMKNEDEWI